MSLSRTTSQAMTHKYSTLLELLCGYVAGCWKMLTAILTASERFLYLEIISQEQPPQGVTRVFKTAGDAFQEKPS
ncbi:hypothetical protein DPMN_087232 [Dreissena polymorpha]|uniref:Uncharacterized protein n=1 Tax=Dreissena polymorpha TaxID=45954 RepID=A0A9D4QWP7_DREPO|nr:hypothetical protein DPMN_087232 [Dreissena polymorpha]